MIRSRDDFPSTVRRILAGIAACTLVAFQLALGPFPALAQGDTTQAVSSGAGEGKSAAPPHPRIVIRTEKRGDIVIELYPEEAPKAVERITSLVSSKFYDGIAFHRVESYVVQTGAAESDLAPIEGEMFSQRLTHEDGMVGMARLIDDYDSAKTQFFICKKHLPLMNGEYTLFGKVVEGLDIVHRLKKGDRIETIRIVE